MNNQNMIKQVFTVVIAIFLITVFLCGCTEYSSTTSETDLSNFIGTWSGNMETSMFGGFRGNGPGRNMTDFRNDSVGNMTDFRNNTSANITELKFTADTLYMTITSEYETQTMSNSYKIEEDPEVPHKEIRP